MPDQPEPAVPAVYDMEQDGDGTWRVTWAASGATVILNDVPQDRMAFDDALDLMDGLEAIDVLTASRGNETRN